MRLRDPFCMSIPNVVKIGQTAAEISLICDLQDGGCRHIGFSKIRNFNIWSAVGYCVRHQAKFRQSPSNGCRDIAILRFLKMAAVRHLGFVKFNFLTVAAVKGPILHQWTKLRKDLSNRFGDIAIFVTFQDGGRRHHKFSKIQKFYGRPL